MRSKDKWMLQTSKTKAKAVERVSEPISPLITPHNVPLSHGSTVSTPDAETVKPEKPKPTIVQDMLEIWNQEIAPYKASHPVRLHKDLCLGMVEAYNYKFGRVLKLFRDYCKLIKTSDFLMKSDFSLTLGWAIKFQTIDLIRRGELGVKHENLISTTSKSKNF